MNIERITKITASILGDIEVIRKHSGSDIRDGDIFYIANDNATAVGYIHARPSISHILALYVLKSYQQSTEKVGSSLLSECIKTLTNNGVSEIYAGVESNNKAVLPFFEKHGFTETGVGKSGFTNITYKV